ncbi:MAG TPA: hypothetical protein VJP45_15405 [Candidatus Limnocylindria bacterium]|nr:hypothetical protein [Candidatus Limnocylindria bacterium]
MLEKLLSLLLHAKSGAVATVFVIGASGALVTATVDDGVTTLTITQPTSSETTGSSTTTTPSSVEQAILALFNRTSAEDDPTSTATAKGCSDEAHERNEHMKRVNDAAKDARDEVKDLGKDARGDKAVKELVHDADTEIKDIRQAAVKAIHATFDCDPHEDGDDDDEDANDEDGDDEDENGDDEDENGDDEDDTSTDTDFEFTGDAEAIADLAIDLMDQVVEDLEADLAELEDTDEEATTSNTKQHGKSDGDNKGKGKGNSGKGRSR